MEDLHKDMRKNDAVYTINHDFDTSAVYCDYDETASESTMSEVSQGAFLFEAMQKNKERRFTGILSGRYDSDQSYFINKETRNA